MLTLVALISITTAQQLLLKKDIENHHVRRVAVAILSYLREHPEAKDSVQGIAKWWVGEKQEIVEQALALLMKVGVIKKQKHLYGLAECKTAAEQCELVEKLWRRLQRGI